MKILVINGPNINMLGIREKNIYGAETYEDLKALLEKTFAEKGVEGEIYQSNHEGDLVDRIQQAYFDGTEGIVINPAAYTHTSVAILDALKAVQAPCRTGTHHDVVRVKMLPKAAVQACGNPLPCLRKAVIRHIVMQIPRVGFLQNADTRFPNTVGRRQVGITHPEVIHIFRAVFFL